VNLPLENVRILPLRPIPTSRRTWRKLKSLEAVSRRALSLILAIWLELPVSQPWARALRCPAFVTSATRVFL
jgi:hypothetical protein